MGNPAKGSTEVVGLVQETTPGETPIAPLQLVIPNGAPTPPERRNEKSASTDLTGRRRTQDNVFRGYTVEGAIPVNNRFGDNDLLWRALMDQAAPAAPVSVTGVDIAVSDSAPHLSSATADKFNVFAVGDGLYLGGDGGNNAVFAVVTAKQEGATPSLTLAVIYGSLATEAAGPNITIFHSGVISHQTNPPDAVYLSYEVANPDRGHYKWGRGMIVTQAQLAAAKGSDPTTSFSLSGLDADSNRTGSIGTGDPIAAPANKIYNQTGGLLAWMIGAHSAGADLIVPDWSVQLAVANNSEIGVMKDGPYCYSKNDLVITGNFNAPQTNLALDLHSNWGSFEDRLAWLWYDGVNAELHVIERLQGIDPSSQRGGGQDNRGLQFTFAGADSGNAGYYSITKFANVPGV